MEAKNTAKETFVEPRTWTWSDIGTKDFCDLSKRVLGLVEKRKLVVDVYVIVIPILLCTIYYYQVPILISNIVLYYTSKSPNKSFLG